MADSNLIAYLLIEGDRTQAAEAVLERDPAWAAPVLWRSEVRNVLALYLRRGNLELSLALQYMNEAESLLAAREYHVPSGPILELAQLSGCTAYDGEFVHLASELSVPLVTSDRALLHAFPDIAISPEDFVS